MTQFPNVVAHRGFKSKYAENTFSAFNAASKINVDVIETDVQVTKDGYVVINHDPNTGRNYDKNLIINEVTLEDLKQLVNIQDNTQRLITLREFLEWFVEQPDDLKVMLDIKSSNNTDILTKILNELIQINKDLKFWNEKVIFGLWTIEFYKFGIENEVLKNFEIINITISPHIGQKFYQFSKSQKPEYQLSAISLLSVATLTREFIKFHREEVLTGNIDLYLWTVNEDEDIEKAILLKAKGIITDKPDVCQDLISGFKSGELKLNQSLIEIPSFLSLKGLKTNTRVLLFKVFEYSLLYGLFRYSSVRFVLEKMKSLIV
ncbi:hypothetical protein WICMUC_005161 [Wickerhamomyces mucosus]|uniref:GP-PDE domain-containing protein n=1 Tax=Wickerhamomyces mucosus TaxID=1378264 RepID=A0A9P8P8U9_9ASCO|nr:hypothetical protein WICMUC_005161 [Wickerhamomyces mucosus]